MNKSINIGINLITIGLAIYWYVYDKPNLEPLIIALGAFLILFNYKSISTSIQKIKKSKVKLKNVGDKSIEIKDVDDSEIEIENN